MYVGEEKESALRERFAVSGCEHVAEGWEDGWRAFHRGIAVGRFWVGPPWVEPPPGAEAIVIDPGRAFGTGSHPTTRLTLELLQEQPAGSFLDVGCGSGVLSIAAARLGFAPVLGLDVDEPAIEVTHENARVNGVEVTARHADALVDALPESDLVVANVALGVVEALLGRVQSGRVVASGYLDRDVPRAAGWLQADRRTVEGWAADLFVRG